MPNKQRVDHAADSKAKTRDDQISASACGNGQAHVVRDGGSQTLELRRAWRILLTQDTRVLRPGVAAPCLHLKLFNLKCADTSPNPGIKLGQAAVIEVLHANRPEVLLIQV